MMKRLITWTLSTVIALSTLLSSSQAFGLNVSEGPESVPVVSEQKLSESCE